ncbi:toll/interleukin-1 receptor domain-containing protein [Kordiimonas laminariae]|uniref:toll/interleukin-1 receptor domain-containing protein n=1 Tax=Kordiimonas laminariae TaxID=2917717 RepID=UPI001FF681FD|nr:toll/interleukin-1 receptor domain-containing protein [Kordiimonas laminariae]
MSNYKYKAFISYSHKDAALGEEIHKELEKYKVPKRLVGKTTGIGVVPLKLGQFFRDREELPVAEDLTAEVAKALGQSEFMIVLCSPSAAASRWVNKEIIEFKKLRGEKYVLPLILSGEPWASDTDDKEVECFPPALRYRISPAGTLSHIRTEPIAADIREQSDGRKRGIQKLIAGLLGVGLDQLVERELQRKQRRVMAITSASILGMIVMGALTYQATTARNAAERHRAEAEDLIEFMLTDLRDKLEPVGRLDVLDAVGTKAVDYYNAQDLDDVSDDAMGRRSRAFHLLGQIQDRRGKAIEAGKMYSSAQQATAVLLARDPDNPQRIFEHAQSVFYLGNQALSARDSEAASVAMQEYKRLAERLVDMEPYNIEWQKELAYAHSNIGTLQLLSLSQPVAAHHSYQKTLQIRQNLALKMPEDNNLKAKIADTYAWIADALLRFGHADEVEEARQKELSILRDLHEKNPKNKVFHSELIAPLHALALLKMYQGKYKDAITYFIQAVAVAKEISTADEANFNKKMQQGYMQIGLAKAYYADGQYSASRTQLEDVKTISQEVLGRAIVRPKSRAHFDFSVSLLNYRINKELKLEQDNISKITDILDRILSNAQQAFVVKEGRRTLLLAYALKIEALREAGQFSEVEQVIQYLESDTSVLHSIAAREKQHPHYMRSLHKLLSAVSNSEQLKQLEKSLLDRGFSTE